MKINCDQCGKEFNRKPYFVKINLEKNNKNYCCKECQTLGQSKKSTYFCKHCGKEIQKTPGQVAGSISGNVFCNKSCAASVNNKLTKSGKNSYYFKDGTTTYAKTAYETYKNECAVCGFDMYPALVVHHIDKNRKNPDLDNLIILCSNCHCLVHYGTLEITEEIKSDRKILNAEFV